MALNRAMGLSPLHLLGARPAVRSFIALRAADELAAQMLNVSIGWYIYATTRDPLSLAYVGLAQFLATIGLALLAGHAADRFDRRRVIALSLFVQTACLAAFGAWSATSAPSPASVYLLMFLVGAARAYAAPAMSAILPRVAGADEFPRAVAASSSVHQICTIAGPAVGGFIYATSGAGVFAVAATLCLLAAIQARRLVPGAEAPLPGSAGERQDEVADKSILAGIRIIRSNRLLLGLISLDLFAVLLGGVTALLPIYVQDILLIGPVGLGWLRCAPGIGAAIVGLVLAHRTIGRGTGQRMLASVAGFGLAIIVFALSANVWVSLIALFAAGGFDMVSMVIRQTLVQLLIPDAVRGRVSAVYWVFIGASSELGEFESGVTAALFGTVSAALLGGLGTLGIVWLWTWLFPELRRLDTPMNAAAERSL